MPSISFSGTHLFLSAKCCHFACLKRLAIISFASWVLSAPPLRPRTPLLSATPHSPRCHSQSRLLSETLRNDFKCIKLDALQQMRLIKMWAEGVANQLSGCGRRGGGGGGGNAACGKRHLQSFCGVLSCEL